jgi:AraC-like DNA-binding protein
VISCPAHSECTVADPLPGWPHLLRVAVEEVRLAAYQRCGADMPAARHWLFKHTLAGAGEVDLGQGWRPLPAGTAFLARRGDPRLRYRYPPGAAGAWRFWYCAFTADDALVGGLHAAAGGLFTPDHRQGDLAALLARARPGRGQAVLAAAESARLVHGLLAALAETVQAAPAPDQGLAEAALARLGDPARPPGIQALARTLGVSREHLSRACCRHLGVPLQRHLQHRQMLHACTLLGRPGASVGTVAAVLGFDTASHFARAFRRVWGVNPAEVLANGGIPPG